jgi:signal transduction histidine kinase/ActR/RegA family two-component response regulator
MNALLDERVDIAVATARRRRPARLFLGACLAVFFGFTVGWGDALIWSLVFATNRLAGSAASRSVRAGRPMTSNQRIACLVTAVVETSCWCCLPVFAWTTGVEAYRLWAMATLAGMMVHANCFSRSSGMVAAKGPIPAALLFVLPVVFGGYSGVQLAVLTVGLATLLGYVIIHAQASVRTSDALAGAEREAVAANAAKSAYLAMMSHELRTPMNGVLGMARALQRTSLDTRQQGYVETILRSGDGLMALLNDVLDITKIEAGHMDLEVAAFDLKDLGAQVVELWSEGASAKRLTLFCEADADLPAAVLGDETRVRQIVMNLVSNALKFTSEGGVRVLLKAAPAADGDGGVEIRVIDTGIGMTAEQLSRLFRPYAQAEASTSRKFGGTGLGLAICRELATRMGGEISVESEPGKGACFRVWLPLPRAEIVAANEEVEDLPPLRILVADDNPINLAVARAVLEAAGAVIETAPNGSEALESLRDGAFDLVLMDVHMPMMDGVEAVGRIRDGQAGPSDIPIIALTADAMAGEEARLKGLGFDALQSKPVQPAALIAAIADVLESRARAAAGANVAA